MEVHTHTHAHTPGKKWTHYFWEFLMLFLAVFCGFLAENYRETIINKEKAHHYIQNMVADLKADTADVNFAIYYQQLWSCLLYTSDAADERSSVDLGGRRIIKK